MIIAKAALAMRIVVVLSLRLAKCVLIAATLALTLPAMAGHKKLEKLDVTVPAVGLQLQKNQTLRIAPTSEIAKACIAADGLAVVLGARNADDMEALARDGFCVHGLVADESTLATIREQLVNESRPPAAWQFCCRSEGKHFCAARAIDRPGHEIIPASA